MVWLLAMLVVLASIAVAAASEDKASDGEVCVQSPTLAYGVAPGGPEPDGLWPANKTTTRLELYATAAEERVMRDLFKTTWRERVFVPEVALLRGKISSRYTVGSWASVNAGYGQYFPGDRIGRVRMNGAGLENPDWVFLKMKVTF